MVLIEFFTMPGCQNCGKVKAVLERVKKDIENIQIKTIDLIEHPEEAQRYGIMGCPALAVDGRVEFVGGVDEGKLRKKLGSP
ncbi:MAG: thioredoxin family protein [Candidatus Hydrothermarchaeaceae archaeon]